MLVLSRKQSEGVLIGPDIEVRVVEIRGDKVRLGFAAPDEVPVHRCEVAAVMASRGEVESLAGRAAPPAAGRFWQHLKDCEDGLRDARERLQAAYEAMEAAGIEYLAQSPAARHGNHH